MSKILYFDKGGTITHVDHDNYRNFGYMKNTEFIAYPVDEDEYGNTQYYFFNAEDAIPEIENGTMEYQLRVTWGFDGDINRVDLPMTSIKLNSLRDIFSLFSLIDKFALISIALLEDYERLGDLRLAMDIVYLDIQAELVHDAGEISYTYSGYNFANSSIYAQSNYCSLMIGKEVDDCHINPTYKSQYDRDFVFIDPEMTTWFMDECFPDTGGDPYIVNMDMNHTTIFMGFEEFKFVQSIFDNGSYVELEIDVQYMDKDNGMIDEINSSVYRIEMADELLIFLMNMKVIMNIVTIIGNAIDMTIEKNSHRDLKDYVATMTFTSHYWNEWIGNTKGKGAEAAISQISFKSTEIDNYEDSPLAYYLRKTYDEFKHTMEVYR